MVSNHGGRILDHTGANIEGLPRIVEAAGDRANVSADGGLRRGGDVLKLQAMGARAVSVGRPLLIAAVRGSAEGVRVGVEPYAGQLKTAMILTRCGDLKAVDSRVLYSDQVTALLGGRSARCRRLRGGMEGRVLTE